MEMHLKPLKKLLKCIPQSKTIQSTYHELIKLLLQAIVEVQLGARILRITHATVEPTQLTKDSNIGISQRRPQ